MTVWQWWLTYLATIPSQVRRANQWLDPAWKPRRHPVKVLQLRQIRPGVSAYVVWPPPELVVTDGKSFTWSAGV